MPQVTPLVFFSSTRDDLEEYRAAVQKMVVGLDILYRGMEFFGSRPQKPRDVMLDELAQCDLYVGIIAQRYGALDPQTGWSFTELEYRDTYKHGIPTMIFLMDQKHPVADSHRESSTEMRNKLKAFRELLNEAHTLESFTTPEDLVSKAAHSLEKWLSRYEPEWRRMLHRPISEHEHGYIRKLHSRRMPDVEDAIERLGPSSNPIVHEHLYARLCRGDLPEKIFRNVLAHSIHWQDERRLTQMLFGMVDDLPDRRRPSIFALGHRAFIDGKSISSEEVLFVLKHERDLDSGVRVEVAHALGKLYKKSNSTADESLAALQRLSNDPEPSVREKARQVLERIPHDAAHRAGAT